MIERITFGEIERLLEECGFVPTSSSDGKYPLFEHKDTGVILMFRPHRRNERVDPMTLSIVRTKLDMNGFIEKDDFADALREASVNGASKARKK